METRHSQGILVVLHMTFHTRNSWNVIWMLLTILTSVANRSFTEACIQVAPRKARFTNERKWKVGLPKACYWRYSITTRFGKRTRREQNKLSHEHCDEPSDCCLTIAQIPLRTLRLSLNETPLKDPNALIESISVTTGRLSHNLLWRLKSLNPDQTQLRSSTAGSLVHTAFCDRIDHKINSKCQYQPVKPCAA